jgi:hypothetical protein
LRNARLCMALCLPSIPSACFGDIPRYLRAAIVRERLRPYLWGRPCKMYRDARPMQRVRVVVGNNIEEISRRGKCTRVPGTPIRYALWHWVRFVPNDVLAQIPTIGLEGECDAPWDANQIFRSKDGMIFPSCMFSCTHVVVELVIHRIIKTIVRASCPIRISEIEPQRPVVSKATAHCPEYLHKPLYIFFRRVFKTDLSVNAIIAKSKVGRRCYTCLYILFGELFQFCETIPLNDFVHICVCPRFERTRKLSTNYRM